MLAEEELQAVMPEIVEGCCQVQEGCRGSDAAYSHVGSARGLQGVVVVGCVPRSICGIDQPGYGVLCAVGSAESMLAGVDVAGRIRSDAGVDDALRYLGDDRCQGDWALAAGNLCILV